MAPSLQDILLRAEVYRRNCEVIARAHYMRSDELEKSNFKLGIPVLAATTIVGTTIFGTLQSNPVIGWKIATGIISIGAALLSGLQTLLNFSERASKHKAAAATYSAIRREFEIFQLRYQNLEEARRDEAITALDKLNQELTKVGQSTSNVPDRNWDKAYKEVDSGTPEIERLRQKALQNSNSSGPASAKG
jgi:hypothetical protein